MFFFAVFLGTITVLGLSVVALVLAFQSGYLNQFEPVRNLITTVRQSLRVINAYVNIAQPIIQTHCSINDSRESAVITYTSSGREKLINVPYNRQIKEEMRGWRLNLIKIGNVLVDITQEPGYPYMCTPQQLGGIEIIARHLASNQTISYIDCIPGYLGLASFQLEAMNPNQVSSINDLKKLK